MYLISHRVEQTAGRLEISQNEKNETLMLCDPSMKLCSIIVTTMTVRPKIHFNRLSHNVRHIVDLMQRNIDGRHCSIFVLKFVKKIAQQPSFLMYECVWSTQF